MPKGRKRGGGQIKGYEKGRCISEEGISHPARGGGFVLRWGRDRIIIPERGA